MKTLLIFGGDSLESEVSILTALKIYQELDHHKYALTYLNRNGKFYYGKGLSDVNNYPALKNTKKGYFYKDDISYLKLGLRKIKVDKVILLTHGENAEDGTLKAFFDTLKIKCLGVKLNKGGILQNKYLTKLIAKDLKIPTLNSKLITSLEEIENLKYPLIAKANKLGSSIGIKIVDKLDYYAFKELFRYDEEIIIEEKLEDFQEINIAIFKYKEEYIFSELEEVNDENKILSFLDKYDNYEFNEKHKIPAPVSNLIKEMIKEYTLRYYKFLNIYNIVRFDYFIKDEQIYLNEINTIPGSLAYYLFKDKYTISELISMQIFEFNKDNIVKGRMIKKINQDALNHLKEK